MTTQKGSEEPIPGRCNYTTEDGNYCQMYPAKNDNGGEINGFCYHHVQEGEVEDPRAANAMTHGVYSMRSTYYQNQSGSQQALMDHWFDSFLEKAPWDDSHGGKVELLRNACIDLHKIRSANERIDDVGMTEMKVMDVDEFNDEIETEVENILNVSKQRLSTDVRSTLKDLGVLDEETDDAEKAVESLAEVFANIASNSEEGE